MKRHVCGLRYAALLALLLPACRMRAQTTTDPGTLTASPNPATTTSSVQLSAGFGSGTGYYGIPNGTITFTDTTAGTTLGTATPAVSFAPFEVTPSSSLTLTGTSYQSAVGDLNGDGISDFIFWTNGSNVISYTLSSGRVGAFTSSTITLPITCTTSFATIADVNGDGHPDIVAMCYKVGSTTNIYTYLNSGTGTFTNTPLVTSISVTPTAFGVADFNKDGKLDVVLAGTLASGGKGFATLLGNNTGQFNSGTTNSSAAYTTLSQFLAVDLNNDGAADIALYDSGQQGLLIYQNTGAGAFSSTPTNNIAVGSGGTRLISRPFPGSSYPDLLLFMPAASGTANGCAPLYLNNTTAAGGAVSIGSTGYENCLTGATSFAIGDFNGDGYLDLALSTTGTVGVFPGYNSPGNKLFNPSVSGAFTTTPAGEVGGGSVVLQNSGNINGDSFADLPMFLTSGGNSVFYNFVTAGSSSGGVSVSGFSAGSHNLTATIPAAGAYAAGTATTILVVNPPPDALTGVTPAALPAGSPATTVTISGTYSTVPAGFCFYNALGTSSPVAATAVTGNAGAYTAVVPAAILDSVPQTSFSSGAYNLTVYPVASLSTTCTGNPSSTYTNTTTLALNLPTLSAVGVALSQHNPNLTAAAAPTLLDLEGTNFLPTATATFSSGLGTPTVTYLSSTALRAVPPATQPAGTTRITVTVCNAGTANTYCTSSQSIRITALTTNPGSLTTAPASPKTTDAVSLLATFGSATSGAGIPTGSVTFTDTTTAQTLGSSALSLKPAPFVAGTASTGVQTNYTPTALVADFNKDGLPDVLLYDPTNPVLYFMLGADNHGSYTSGASFVLQTPNGCDSITAAVGDFNKDGYPDVAVLCSSDSESYIYVLTNQGDATFVQSGPIASSLTPDGSSSQYDSTIIATGDFNKDGNTDIIIGGTPPASETTGFVVFFGNGAGGFTSIKQTLFGDASLGGILVTDLNNDGYPDLVVTTGLQVEFDGGATVSVLQNDGTGAFTCSSSCNYNLSSIGAYGTFDITPRTLPGSSYPDLVVGFFGNTTGFAVLPNSHSSAIAFGTPVVTTLANINDLVVGDFNGDTYPDVLIYDGANLQVYDSDTSGNYSTPNAAVNTAAPNLVLLGATDDVNADGYADLPVLIVDQVSNYLSSTVQSFITSGTASATLGSLSFAAGSHTVTATTPGTVTYAAGTASLTFNVAANPDVLTAAAPNALPAGSPATTVTISGAYTAVPAGFCFYNGSSSSPIAASPVNGNAGAYTVAVPAATLSPVPQASFANGVYTYTVYPVASLSTACTGATASYSNSVTFTLNLPTLAAVSVSLSQHNANLTTNAAPTLLDLDGTNFLSTSTATFSTAVGGTVAYVSPTLLRAVPAATQPTGTTALTVQVCNPGATNTYCSAAQNITITPLATNTGTLTATPNTTVYPTTAVSLAATFGSATSGAGIPTGLVTFTDTTAGTTLGSAALSLLPAPFTAPTVSPAVTGLSLGYLKADFNGDGLPDILLYSVNTASPFTLSMLLGSTDHGAFVAGPSVTVSASSSYCSTVSAATADFNGDGYPDVAVLCNLGSGNSQITVLLNQGDGTFVTGSQINNTIEGLSIATADFNHDGKVDLVVEGPPATSAATTSFQVLFGDGTGKFTISKTVSVTGQSGALTQAKGSKLVPVDLNNDGYPDLAVLDVGYSQTYVYVFQNDGTGGFAATAAYERAFGTGTAAFNLLPRILPGSAYPDLVVGYSGAAGGFSVIPNNKTSAIGFGTAVATSVANLSSFAVADVDGDTYPDVAAYNGTNIQVFNSSTTGTYSSAEAGFTTTASNLTLIGSDDVNGDGYADLPALVSTATAGTTAAQTYIASGTAQATLSSQTFAAGSHTLTATTVGTGTYAAGAGSTTLAVLSATPTVSLGVTPVSPATYSPTNTESLTVQVASAQTPAPTGTVNVVDTATSPATTVGTGTLTVVTATSSAVTLTGIQLTAGTHQLQAMYLGNGSYTAANSTIVPYVVNKGTPTITWTPNPSTIAYGTALTSAQLDATATIAGATIPGTMSYTYNGAQASGAVLPVGQQTVSLTFTPTDTIDYNTVSNVTTTITVQPATTSINLTSSLNPSTFNAQVTFTAAISSSTGAVVSGTMTFYDSGSSIGAVGFTGGSASLSTSSLSAGPHSITATYTASTNFATSTSNTVTQTVNAGTFTLTLGSSLNPSQYNQSVTFTASAAITYTGNITFYDGSTSIGTGTFSAGSASITTTSLAVGPHSITAVFPGNSSYVQTTSNTVTQTVSAGVTSIQLTSSVNPSQFNQPTTLAATITSLYSGVPTGSIAFYDGQTLLGTAPITAGVASLPVSTLAVASHSLTAVYAATTNFAQATSNTVTQTVGAATTNINLTSSQNPSQFNQPVTLTAAISTPYSGAAPTGSIAFFDGQTSLGTAAITAGVASLPVSNFAVASHSLTAVYTATGSFGGSTSNTVTQVVGAVGTTIVLGSSPNPSQFNQTVTLTANITPTYSGTAIGGSMSFYDGATLLGSANISAGTASLPVSTLGAGPHSLTAKFIGNTNFAASTSNTVTQTVSAATTGINLTSSANPSQFNQPVTFTATITAGSGGSINGNITFYDGQTSLGSPAIANNIASLPISTLSAGSHNITAVFAGSTSFAQTTSNTVTQVVNPGTTSIVLSSSPNPSQFNQPVTLTANITSTYTGTAISGSIAFSDGATPLGTAPITAGSATLSIATLAAGSHSLTAVYTAGTSFAGSTSNTVVQTVNPGTTTILLNSSGSPTNYNQSVTFTAAISSTYTGTAPSGILTFSDGATVLGTGTIGNGSATYTTSSLTGGAHSITAAFAASSNFAAATSNTVVQTVNAVKPTLTWPTPADVVAGTVLSSTQLDATATGVTGATLPGTFKYTPDFGTAVTAGTQTLSVLFTPTDAVDYTTATASVQLNVLSLGITSLSSTTATLGDPPTTITITGVGFLSNSVVTANGNPVSSTYVNATTLTAIIPASYFTTVQSVKIVVSDPTQAQTSNAATITVTAPPVSATISLPTTLASGSQPTANFTLSNPYPVPLTATFTLAFTPQAGLTSDPNVQFATGGQTYTITIPANSASTTPVLIQTGTVAGTITFTTVLTAGGAVVTPATVTPIVVTIPASVPILQPATLVRNGGMLTITITGFSNTREVSSVDFQFVAQAGSSLATTSLTIDGASLFPAYFAGSAAYGSAFVYTQTFNVNESATVVGAVKYVVHNSVGSSTQGTAQ